MLSRARAVLMGISQLVFTLVYWAPAVIGFSVWETMNATGQGHIKIVSMLTEGTWRTFRMSVAKGSL